MKKRLQGIVMGVVATVLLFGGVAAAAARTQDINVTFRDIKLMIDGKEFTPRDSDGNIVEPFIYQGTTYLPLRAVGEAFGMDIDWKSDTSTVYIDSGAATATPEPPVSTPAPTPAPQLTDTGITSVAIVYANRPVNDLTLQVGERVPLYVRIEPVGIEQKIVWSSSDTSVFEVALDIPEGTAVHVTGRGAGTGTLTVKVDGVEATCIIRVRG